MTAGVESMAEKAMRITWKEESSEGQSPRALKAEKSFLGCKG
jgi:hypothetical protein